MYPGLDRDMAAPSITALADAPMLSLDDINYMHDLADIGAGAPHDAYRVPAYATNLSGLPAAIVATATCDPIRDWGERYAARLRDGGVQTTLTRYPGVYHGFLMRADATARGRLAIAEIGAQLRRNSPTRFRFNPVGVPITGQHGLPRLAFSPQSTHQRMTRGDLMLTDERRMELSDVLRHPRPHL